MDTDIIMGRQQRSLRTLKVNLEQSIEKAELDCHPHELSQLKKCYAEISRLVDIGNPASKEALEKAATSISALSDQSPTYNSAVEQTAVGMRLLAATA